MTNLQRLTAALLIAASSAAAVADDEPAVDFDRDLAPIFRAKCVACHNSSKAESDVVLESFDAIAGEGAEFELVAPGVAEDSLLWAVAAGEIEPTMPPEDNEVGAEPLTEEELALLRRWIDAGAEPSAAGESPGDAIAWQRVPSAYHPALAAAIDDAGTYAVVSRGPRLFAIHVPTRTVAAELIDAALAGEAAHLDVVQSAAIAGDGRVIASGGYRTIKLWRRVASAEIARTTGVAGPYAVSTEAPLVAFVQKDGAIALWNWSEDKLSIAARPEQPRVTAIAFSAAGDALFWAAEDGSLARASLAAFASGDALQPVAQSRFDGSAVELVYQDSPGDVLIVLADGRVLAWDGVDQSEPRELAGPPISQWVAAPREGAGDAAKWAAVTADGAVAWANAMADSIDVQSQVDAGTAVRGVAALSGRQVVLLYEAGKLSRVPAEGEATSIAADPHAAAKLQKLQVVARVAAAAADHAESLLTEATTRQEAEAKLAAAAAEELEKAGAALAEKEQQVADAAAAQASAEASIRDAQVGLEASRKLQEQAKQSAENLAASLASAAEALGETTNSLGEETATALREQLEALRRETSDQLAAAVARHEQAAVQAEEQRKQAEAALSQAQDQAKKLVEERNAAASARDTATNKKTRADEVAARAQQALQEATAEAEARRLARDEANSARDAAARELEQSTGDRLAVAASPAGRRFAVVGAAGVRLFDAATGAWELDVPSTEGAIHSATFVGEHELLTIGADGVAIVWNVRPAWELEVTVAAADSTPLVDRVTALDFDPAGERLAIGSGFASRSGQLQVRRVADGALDWQADELHSDVIYGVAFSPTGEYLATAAADRNVKVTRATDGELLYVLEGHTHHALAVAWRADGAVLASGGADSALKIWDFFTGRQRRSVGGPGKEATGVAFLGEGAEVAAAWGDGAVRVYDSNEGRELRSIAGAGGFLHALAVDRDGGVAVATSAGGEAVFFDAAAGDDRAVATLVSD